MERVGASHLTAARGGAREPMMGDVNLYVEKLAALTNDIDEYRAHFLCSFRYLQGLLIVLAIGSLFAIMALLLRWVIRPLSSSAAPSDGFPRAT